MKKIIVLLVILVCQIGNTQNLNPKIIVLPENCSVEDFSFLKEEIKEAQVVMLGEESHFAGNVFEMKTKIIKYLHQEMGFNTIAFESGVYDAWKAQCSINNGESIEEALKNSLFSIWAKRKEFQSFIAFYDQNKKDLKLYGFDNQITGKFGEEQLVNDLYKFCSQNQLKLKLKHEDFQLLVESMFSSGVFDEGDITYEEYKTALTQLLNNIANKPKSEERFYWMQIIKNLLALAEYHFSKEIVLSSFYTTSDDNIRDKQMADNLLEYVKSHPGEKIICWGANQHFANDMSSISAPVLKEFVPMGSYIKNALKDKVYSLAMVSAADSIYLQNKWNKTPINEDSFEYYLKKNKKSHLYISSSLPEMKKMQSNRLFSPITFVEARLDLLHDGYLYFDKVIQSTPIVIDEKEMTKKSELTKNQIEKENNIVFQQAPDNSDLKVNALNEVLIYSKRTPYQIIKKTIDNLNKNYPSFPFNSNMYSNVITNVGDVICLDLDFVSDQYDFPYTDNYRSTKQIKELRWNIKNGYEPQNLREYHGLVYNNPIKYAPFLDNRKFKKFIFNLEEIIKYDNKEVFVISFSSTRNHSTYTKRIFLSNYTGKLYVNKEDYALVKIIENWEVTKFPEEFKQGLELRDWLAKYTKKEFVNEAIETDFVKIDNLYYIAHSEITLLGKLIDKDNKSLDYKTTINSFWSDFNSVNPKEISNKEEQHLFGKINFNKIFWDSYVLPKKQ